jgi:hypothetical protein
VQQLKGKLLLVEWATLLYYAAWYVKEKERENVTKAEQFAVKSIKTRQKMPGGEHKEN